MAKALYAVDEMSGFVTACALVRPTGIEGMKPKSVKKKLKQPSFAAAVDRDQLGARRRGARGRDGRAHPGRDRRARRTGGGARPRRAKGTSRPAMRRGWKIVIGVARRPGVLLDPQHDRARQRDQGRRGHGGRRPRSSSSQGGDIQVLDTGRLPPPLRVREQPGPQGAHRRSCCSTATRCAIDWWDGMIPLLQARAPRDRDRPARARRLGEAGLGLLDGGAGLARRAGAEPARRRQGDGGRAFARRDRSRRRWPRSRPSWSAAS